MKSKILAFAGTAAAGMVAMASISAATITFDSGTGTGFVGKGDVQHTLGLNNKQAQALESSGGPSFEYASETIEVTEVEWTCGRTLNNGNELSQERARTTTTESENTGVVASLARVKNQVTGYNLNGYSSSTSTSSSIHDGPAVNSCPTSWTLIAPAGAPEVISSVSTGGLMVNGVVLQEKPAV